MQVAACIALLLAAPDAGTTWTWSFDDAISVKLEKGAGDIRPAASLRRAQVSVTVSEAGETAPKRLVVHMLEGNDSLKGRTWNVESNYGEPVLSEVGGKKRGPPGTVTEAVAELQKTPEKELRVLTRVVGTLLTADPIVEAALSGPPCDEAVRVKVGNAAAKLTTKLAGSHGEELTIGEVAAACDSKKPGRWNVQFALTQLFQDQPLVMNYRGTAVVAPGAWRATLALQGAGRFAVGSGPKALRVRSDQTLKSSMTQK